MNLHRLDAEPLCASCGKRQAPVERCYRLQFCELVLRKPPLPGLLRELRQKQSGNAAGIWQ